MPGSRTYDIRQSDGLRAGAQKRAEPGTRPGSALFKRWISDLVAVEREVVAQDLRELDVVAPAALVELGGVLGQLLNRSELIHCGCFITLFHHYSLFGWLLIWSDLAMPLYPLIGALTTHLTVFQVRIWVD